MAGTEHASSRERFLQAAKQQEDEERNAKNRLLQQRRAAQGSKRKEPESKMQIEAKKKKEDEDMEKVEMLAGGSRAGVWTRDEFKQQALTDASSGEAENAIKKAKALERKQKIEAEAFAAERANQRKEEERVEAQRRAAAAVAQEKLAKQAAEKAKRQTRFVVAPKDNPLEAHKALAAKTPEEASAIEAPSAEVPGVESEGSAPSSAMPGSTAATAATAALAAVAALAEVAKVETGETTLQSMIRKAKGKLRGEDDMVEKKTASLGLLGGYNSDESSDSDEST